MLRGRAAGGRGERPVQGAASWMAVPPPPITRGAATHWRQCTMWLSQMASTRQTRGGKRAALLSPLPPRRESMSGVPSGRALAAVAANPGRVVAARAAGLPASSRHSELAIQLPGVHPRPQQGRRRFCPSAGSPAPRRTGPGCSDDSCRSLACSAKRTWAQPHARASSARVESTVRVEKPGFQSCQSLIARGYPHHTPTPPRQLERVPSPPPAAATPRRC